LAYFLRVPTIEVFSGVPILYNEIAGYLCVTFGRGSRKDAMPQGRLDLAAESASRGRRPSLL
jgi:hypothetical protein